MINKLFTFFLFAVILLASACSDDSTASGITIRVASFNIQNLTTASLNTTTHTTVLKAAAIIKQIKPDILILNEIDHDYDNLDKGYDYNARLLVQNYLDYGPNPISYTYSYAAPNNTGISSGIDLNGNGTAATNEGQNGYGDDCYGYGDYRGQYSMAILSRYPIVTENIRTFQKFLWKDLPGNSMPTESHWTNAIIQTNFRLSSKSHWDIPVLINGRTVHFLLSHPTPPSFDSAPIYHNRRRNYDEIKFWAHYISNDNRLIDDNGTAGGLTNGTPFVICGDLNSYPNSTTLNWDGNLAINQLLNNPAIIDSGEYMTSSGGAAGKTTGAPKYYERSTATWGDGARVDYLLPSAGTGITGGGVYWPLQTEDAAGYANATGASDHRLVWLDLKY